MAGRWPALLVAVLGAGAAAGLSLEPVVWHTGNRRFLAAGGYVLYPQIGDRLDLVCPAAGSRAAGGGASAEEGVEGRGYEYYKLYLVGGAHARRCQLPPGRAPPLLLSCDRPRRELRFTLKFQEFSPSQWGPEFRRRRDYYIITTSDGTREGLENRQGGACASHAMRVTLRVGQRPESSLEQEEAGPANQTSPLPGPGPTPVWGQALAGGAGGGAAALLALAGAGGALWWRRWCPRKPPPTPRGAPPRPRPHGPAPACPLRDLAPPPAAPPPTYYKV